jgi:hypothetical protein
MLWEARPMRWLLIAFLVSLGSLLFAVAGMARHIWLQRAAMPPNDEEYGAVNRAANDIHSNHRSSIGDRGM